TPVKILHKVPHKLTTNVVIVPIISNSEPCHDQNVDEFPQTLPDFHPACYSGDENSFACDSTPNLVNDSPNIFYPPFQPPMYSYEFCGNDAQYNHNCPPQIMFIYNPKPCYNQDFNFPQKFQSFQQQYPCCESCRGPHETFQCQQMIFYDPCCENCGDQVVNLDPYSPKPLQCRKIPICYDDDDDEESSTPTLSTKETKDSLIMGDEHLDTIPEKESDEFIKSSVENLIDSLLDEFAGKLILLKSIPPGIDEADCNPEEEICLIKKLLYDNLSPRPPKEINSKNSDALIKSFSLSPILIEDSDSLMKEIDLSLTPDDSMPLGIENDDYDFKGDILILEELLSNDSLSLPKNESFHFDILSSPRPLAKPPDDDEIEPNWEF
nr:hypothetical protein [Tanacetum cinerariifolium]